MVRGKEWARGIRNEMFRIWNEGTCVRVEGGRFKVEGWKWRVQGLGLKVEGGGLSFEGWGLRIEDWWLRVEGRGLRDEGWGLAAKGGGLRYRRDKDEVMSEEGQGIRKVMGNEGCWMKIKVWWILEDEWGIQDEIGEMRWGIRREEWGAWKRVILNVLNVVPVISAWVSGKKINFSMDFGSEFLYKANYYDFLFRVSRNFLRISRKFTQIFQFRVSRNPLSRKCDVNTKCCI